MITESTMYWLTRLDGIRNAITGLGIAATIIGGVVIVGLLAVWGATAENEPRESIARFEEKLFGRLVKAAVPVVIGIILLIANVFVPTTREMAAIWAIPAVANSKRAEKVGDDAAEVYDLAVDWAKEQLKAKGE